MTAENVKKTNENFHRKMDRDERDKGYLKFYFDSMLTNNRSKYRAMLDSLL